MNGSTVSARQDENADRIALAHQRDAEHGREARRFWCPLKVYSGSASTSGMWTISAFEQRRPTTVPRPARAGRFDELAANPGEIRSSLRVVEHRRRSRVMPALVGLAEPRRRFCQRVEHRLQIEGRAADDLEHVGGRCLLLQRLAELRGARLDLFEQAHVLDGDDRLVGKGLHQLDLPLRERPASGRDNDITPSTLPSRFNGTARPAR